MCAEIESDDKSTVIKPVAEAEGIRRKVREAPTTIDEMEVAQELPIMPLPETVIYPHIVAPLLVTDENMIKLIDEVLVGDRIIGVVTLVDSEGEPEPPNLYDVGSAVAIARMFKLPDGNMQLLAQGVARIRIKDYTQTQPYLKANVERQVDRVEDTVELEALTRNALNLFRKIVNLAPYLPDELFVAAMNVDEPNDLSDFLSANINMSTAEKQELLEQLDVKERLKRLTVFLNREVEVLEIGSKIQDQVQSELSKGQREFFLREQLKAIQKELGELDEKAMEINELREAIAKAGMPEEARKEAERELERLANMPAAAAEYTVARTYLDWMIYMPWSKGTEDNLDVKRAARILDEDHYDLDKVKQRIVEYLAVRNIKEDIRGRFSASSGRRGSARRLSASRSRAPWAGSSTASRSVACGMRRR